MALELVSQRFCTLTHYVQVTLHLAPKFIVDFFHSTAPPQLSVDSVLVLHIHTLPENEDAVVWTSQPSGPSASVGLPPPFSWLAERHMQVSMSCALQNKLPAIAVYCCRSCW